MNYERVEAAAAALARSTGFDHHDVAVVLGSGLGSYAAAVADAVVVPYEQVPGLPLCRVEGHSGTLYSYAAGGGRVLAFSGRVHAYEGWDLDDVVIGVRAAVAGGARAVLLTNAAGGAGDGLAPGDLVSIKDHVNLTGRSPLLGDNDPRLGPRFPDLTAAYSQRLREEAAIAFAASGVAYREGVYAWFLGPSYETPAEVQMARRLGADLVGMSTVPETIAARHMGAEVVAISLVTNLAAGISATPLSHEEVADTAGKARARFSDVLDRLIPRVVAATMP